jgi:hypothetical protein
VSGALCGLFFARVYGLGCFSGCTVGLPMYAPRRFALSCVLRGTLRFFDIYNITYKKKKKTLYQLSGKF